MPEDPRDTVLREFLAKWQCADDHPVLERNWDRIFADPDKRYALYRFLNPPRGRNRDDLAADTAIIIFDGLDD